MDLSRAFFVHSPRIEQLHYPPECPFKTERASMTLDVLRSMGYPTGTIIEPVPLSNEQLLSFHTPRYIEILQAASTGTLDAQGLLMGLGTPETPIFKEMFEYACLAAGGTVRAAQVVLDGSADIVFNPSGGYHHALSDKAGGFCYINDIVIACNELLAAGRRVLCLDLDAHHGNGQQAAFYERSDIMTISFHEDGRTLYPWGGFVDEIGENAGTGYNVNVPCPAGTDDETFMLAFREVVPPLVKAFAPDIIVLEIGMDILATDPLTHLAMTNNAIADCLPLVTQFCKPLVVTGGGGYHPANTARGWALAWATLCGVDIEVDLYMGLGGTFLGSTELGASLRDMQSFRSGEEKRKIIEQLGETVSSIKRTVFPIHGIVAD